MNNDETIFQEEELDLKYLTLILWSKKILILSITTIFAILSILFALLTPSTYTSSALLAPTNLDDSLSSKLGSYSSLASMTGINLYDENISKSDEALERIRSFEFFSKYFLPNIKLEDLLAVNYWDAQKNKLVYLKDEFDETNNRWVRKVSYPKKKVPSEQEAFKAYEEIIQLSSNKQTSFISLSIEHKSPIIAKEWLDIIIYNINESMRLKDITVAQSYIDFLNESQRSTNVQSLKEVASKLLESQMQTLMLASSNEDYVFQVIDPPIVTEEESGPDRLIIVIFGTMIGLALSLLAAYIQYTRVPNKD